MAERKLIIDLSEVVSEDLVEIDYRFDGCASMNCPFYWGEWSMSTPDNPSEYDCGCVYEPESISTVLEYQFIDGGADQCPVLALVRVARALGISDDQLEDLNEAWKYVLKEHPHG